MNKNEVIIIEHSGGKSDIWKLFGKISDGQALVSGFVACKACKKVYVYQPSDGTQTLRRHQCDKGQSGPKAKKGLPLTKQSTSFNWSSAGFSKVVKDTVPASTKIELNRTAVLACALDYRPLSFVKCEGFQLLAQSLIEIGAKYPTVDAKTLFNSHSTYSRKVLPKLADEARSSIRTSLSEQFKSMPKSLCPAAFTGDHWTDKYRQVEYTSVAVSYVDAQFKLNVYDLCVKEYGEESKHAQCIRNDVVSKLKEYGVSETELNREGRFVFVCDSDAKLVAAVREDFDRQSCVAHDLSLAEKYALKNIEKSSVALTIEACKTLVRFFKKSGLNRQLTKTLKQEVSTRFNSIYMMLSSVDDVFDEVTVVLTKNESLSYLADIKRKTLQAVAKQLKRFQDATLKLAVENEETLHLVIPVLHELHSKLLKEADKYRLGNESDMAVLCTELARGVKDKCLSKVTWYHCAASVLYPPFLHHPGLLSRESEVARIRSDLQVLTATLEGLHDSTGPPVKKAKKLLLYDSDSDEDGSDENVAGSGDADPRATDVDKYFSSSFDCDDLRPLQFWKNQASAKGMPKMSVIARSVYAIPATQNRSERAFSSAGHVVTDLRTTIDPEHVDELLLIRSHYRQGHDRARAADKDTDEGEED